VDPTDPGEEPGEHRVPVGTKFVWDTCSIRTGFHRPVKGRYLELLTPLHLPDPELPPNSNPAELKVLTKSQVWIDGFDGLEAALRELSITGPLALNAMARLYHDLGFYREMQEGLIPVLEICECAPYENGYGKFGVPVLKLVGWVPRDADLFGPIITPPPSPIVGGPRPKPQVTDEVPPSDSKPKPSAAAADEPEQPSTKDDPLESFRPSKKKPF
jgi:hypothetical protein